MDTNQTDVSQIYMKGVKNQRNKQTQLIVAKASLIISGTRCLYVTQSNTFMFTTNRGKT